MKFATSHRLLITGAALLLSVFTTLAIAQTPAGEGMGGGMAAGGEAGMGAGGQTQNPADQALKYRQALFTLIAGNFGTVGNMLQGRAEFNGATALKNAERTAQLAAMVGDAFPDLSKTATGTKSSADIWNNRAEFDKLTKDFADHSAALFAVLKKDNKTASAEFKTAATAVAGDCKACHDKFRTK